MNKIVNRSLAHQLVQTITYSIVKIVIRKIKKYFKKVKYVITRLMKITLSIPKMCSSRHLGTHVTNKCYINLQIVQKIVQFMIGLRFDALAYKVGQLMRILTRCRYSDGTRPIVVQMTKFVRQSLHVVSLHVSSIVKNNVVGRRDRPLPHQLRHQIEVVQIPPGDC